MTYDDAFYVIVDVGFPHVWCCMLLEGVPSMRSNEFESAFGVWPNSNASAYFAKGVCSFVDVDINVVVLEETECQD